MSWSDPDTTLNPSTGATISTAWGDMINGNLGFLYGKPRCWLSRAAAQTITGSGAISWDTETTDTDSMWASSPNPTRITPQTSGLFLVIGNVDWVDDSDTSRRVLEVHQNGSATGWYSSYAALSGNTTGQQVFGIVSCNGSTDYIELNATEGSATTVNIATARVFVSWLSAG